MITPNSRYASADVVTVTDRRGAHQSVEVSSPSIRSFEFTYYVIKGDDRIDTIADSHIGSAIEWWRIADANPEILDWHNLTPGTIIRIPLVQ